jgi:hypothetical protein
MACHFKLVSKEFTIKVCIDLDGRKEFAQGVGFVGRGTPCPGMNFAY